MFLGLLDWSGMGLLWNRFGSVRPAGDMILPDKWETQIYLLRLGRLRLLQQ